MKKEEILKDKYCNPIFMLNELYEKDSINLPINSVNYKIFTNYMISLLTYNRVKKDIEELNKILVAINNILNYNYDTYSIKSDKVKLLKCRNIIEKFLDR